MHAPDEEPYLLVLNHGQVTQPAPALNHVLGAFHDNGQGGGIAAAQAADGRYGYLDTHGAWVIEPTLDKARTFADNGLARFCSDGRWGYLDLTGNTVIAPQYEDAQAFSAGLAAVRTAANKWTYIDTSGKPAFKGAFREARSFSAAGLAVASTKRDLFGYIDASGDWAIAPRFARALAFSAQGVAPASEDGELFGLIGLRGEWILQPCHRKIGQFNADGLAYCEEAGERWDDGGYINARGEHVIRHKRRLSPSMSCGFAVEANGAYVNAQGTLDFGVYVSWAHRFNQFGFGIARFAGVEQTPQGAVDLPPVWAIARDDASIAMPPADVLEPVTDDDCMVVSAEANTPLAAFIASDKSVALLDRDARVAYRLRAERGPKGRHAALYDAAGALLWQGAPHAAQHMPHPFFSVSADALLEAIDSVDDLITFVEAMMLKAEEKLHNIDALLQAPDGTDEDEDEDDDEDDEDDEDEDDDLDSDEKLAKSVSTSRRIYQSYVDGHVNAVYEFLSYERERMSEAMYTRCMERLVAHFGPADPDPDVPDGSPGDGLPAWQVALRQPIAGPDAPRPESNQLWLSIDLESDNGDGNEWHNIRLLCSPSKETLEAALAGRCPAAPAPAVEVKPVPQTAQEWFDWAYGAKHAITHMPPELIDDAVADYAVERDADALQELPAHLQTPARLERIIRRGADHAADVPGRCMTAEGLALARSLYGDDDDWCRRDKRGSRVPTTFDVNCLYDVWGCLIDEQFCMRALAAGADLGSVPLWLRSETMYATVRLGSSANLRHIPRASITADMVMRVDAGDLALIPEALLSADVCRDWIKTDPMSLGYLPEALRSPELCLAAVKRNTQAFSGVPDALKEDIATSIIARHQGPAGTKETGCRWHALRAWTRLWNRNWEGAISDALLALGHVDDPAHMHYVLASAYRANGQAFRAAGEAAKVRSLCSEYEPEFGPAVDTDWLRTIARSAFNEADEAMVLEELRSNPLVLSQIPGRRITRAMVDLAVGIDPEAVAHVPKRLMTAALYALAVRTNNKRESRVPPAFRSTGKAG
ncbi:WG repeat-containing protein [Massilia violaceinigra]|nr:WG repeat-containing protein [Massilia violaceinigra]